ncbi:MAG: PHP domain-containing protein [bacterium]|nr:PHP domain-containing protein [bacterium]
MSGTPRIDLHLHTTASDGQYPPAEVVALARQRGLTTIAITDHDTTDGVADAQHAARAAIETAQHAAAPGLMNPVVMAGIELSAEDESGDVHMLGYCVNIHHAGLQAQLARFRQDRADRARGIVDKLAALGRPVAYERVVEIAAHSARRPGSIGRPHIARAMIERGYVDSIAEAFARYLNPGAPAYVARERLSPEDAVTLIHAAGGAAVLAHPAKLADYFGMIARLIPAGLDGVEVVHPANDETVRLNLRGLAAAHGLIMTGGSDFHDRADDGTLSIGSLTPPADAPARLAERARQYAPPG